MNPLESFAATAEEADRKFESAAAARGIAVERFPHPLVGPDGAPLASLVARVGPRDASRALLVLSGVHGVEGYAGAGLETGLLLDPGAIRLGADVALLLVHLVNPWGLAWDRREDHENVDCFRNLLYHDAPSEPDPLYDTVEAALDLLHWTDPNRDDRRRQELVERYGLARVVAAIRRGQHHRPQGFTYHGTGPSWSTRTLHAIVDRELRNARHVAVVDVHTGFGAPGAGIVMSYEAPGTERHERAIGWMDGDLYTPGGDFDIPAHPRPPYRFLEDRVPGLSVTPLVLEFGTEPPDVTRDLFPANAYYHLFGDPRSLAGRAVGTRYRQFCYPETDSWKRAVWERGRAVLANVAERVGTVDR